MKNMCEQVRDRLWFYLDDELRGAERDDLESHLVDCEKCRKLFESQRAFLESVRNAGPFHTASPQLRARVADLVNHSSPVSLAPAKKP